MSKNITNCSDDNNSYDESSDDSDMIQSDMYESDDENGPNYLQIIEYIMKQYKMTHAEKNIYNKLKMDFTEHNYESDKQHESKYLLDNGMSGYATYHNTYDAHTFTLLFKSKDCQHTIQFSVDSQNGFFITIQHLETGKIESIESGYGFEGIGYRCNDEDIKFTWNDKCLFMLYFDNMEIKRKKSSKTDEQCVQTLDDFFAILSNVRSLVPFNVIMNLIHSEFSNINLILEHIHEPMQYIKKHTPTYYNSIMTLFSI